MVCRINYGIIAVGYIYNKRKSPTPNPSPVGRGAVCLINYSILAVGYIYNKRNVRRESDVPFIIYTTMPHNSIHVAKKVFVGNYSLLFTSLPSLRGRGRGWGFLGLIYKKKGRHESLAPASQRIMLINVRFCLIRTKSNNIIFTLKSIKLLT